MLVLSSRNVDLYVTKQENRMKKPLYTTTSSYLRIIMRDKGIDGRRREIMAGEYEM